jgi:hypothetical protein
VGIDQIAVLSRTAGLLVFGTLLIAALYALALIAFGRLLRPAHRRRRLLAGLTCTVVFGGWIALSYAADLMIRDAYTDPGTVEPLEFAGAVPILDITVQPAQVRWLDDTTQPEASKDPGLLYFGRNDQFVVLFACRSVLLVPADQVAIYMESTYSDPDSRYNFCADL